MANNPERNVSPQTAENPSGDPNFIGSEANITPEPERTSDDLETSQTPPSPTDSALDQEVSSIESRLAESIRLRDARLPKTADPERVALGRAGEAKWREEIDKGKGHIRNENGHYTTLDNEYKRALLDNEIYNEARKYDVIIRDLERTLELLRGMRAASPESAETTSETTAESDPATASVSETEASEPTETVIDESTETPTEEASAPEEDTPPSEPTTTSAEYSDSGEPPEPPETSDYSPEETEYSPTEIYDPSYSPETPSYTPSPEVEPFQADFVRRVNEIARRDQERAVERYGGFRPFGALAGFLRLIRLRNQAEAVERVDQNISQGWLGRAVGRIRGWFDKVGHRNVLDDEQVEDEAMFEENMQVAGRFERRPWWKKVLKVGAKVLGGFGVAGATILTGGVGAATALLWAGGLKEGYDGVAQTIEHFGWGNRRGAAEIKRQDEMQSKIDNLRQRIINGDPTLTRDVYVAEFTQIYNLERQLMDQEMDNITGERRGQLVRSITTSALTIGTGLLGGVPVGELNYDTDNTAMAETFRQATGQPDLQVMDQSHRGIWNLIHGGQFKYGHANILSAVQDSLNGAVPSGAEYEDMRAIAQFLERQVGGEWPLTDLSPYGQTAHKLADGFAMADWLKVGSPIPYLIGEGLRHGAHRPWDEADYYRSLGRREEEPYAPYSHSAYEHEDSRLESSTPPPELPSGPEKSMEREKKEVSSYIDRLPPDYKETIEVFSEALPPMSEKCRAAICVPAAYSEHRVIYGYLESLLNQTDTEGITLDPESFEVNIFVNGPQANEDDIRQTVSEIDRFKSEHPEMKINVISKSYPERQSIGLLRKIVTDATLKRANERSTRSGELYLVSHDADIRVQDKDYIAKIIDRLDSDLGTQILSGEIDYSEEDKNRYPMIWTARRLWQFIDTIRQGENYANTPRKTVGANSIIRSSAYADVDGFRMSDRLAEDIALGNKINRRFGKKAANGNNTIANFPSRTLISMRRDINSLEQGKPIVGGYENFENNDAVREGIPENNTPQEITPDKRDVFERYLNRELSAQFNDLFMRNYWQLFNQDPRVMEARRNNNKAEVDRLAVSLRTSEIGRQALQTTEKIFNKATSYLGTEIRVSISGQRYRVEATNWDRLKEELERKTT